MSTAHILMLAPALPWPANTGGAVRIAEIFKGLNRHFRVTFMAPSSGMTPPDVPSFADIKAVRTPAPNRFRALGEMALRRYPYHAALYRSAKVKREVSKFLAYEQVHLIYCHFMYASEFLPPHTQVPVCLDSHNVDREYWVSKIDASKGLKRWLARINAQCVLRYEESLLHRMSAYICVSAEDSIASRQYACPPVKHILTAPNGVDLDHYNPSSFSAAEPLTLGFLGSLDVGMNVSSIRHFYMNTWQLVRKLLDPMPRLMLIGRNPAPSLIRLMGKDPSVHFTGTVDDVKPWLGQTDIFIAPLIEGAGTKLKTLEAMAMGLPIVGTPLAFQGLGGINGREYLVAKNDEEFAQSIAMLAKAPAQRLALGHAARAFVEQRFGWNIITDRLAMDLSACFQLQSRIDS